MIDVGAVTAVVAPDNLIDTANVGFQRRDNCPQAPTITPDAPSLSRQLAPQDC